MSGCHFTHSKHIDLGHTRQIGKYLTLLRKKEERPYSSNNNYTHKQKVTIFIVREET